MGTEVIDCVTPLEVPQSVCVGMSQYTNQCMGKIHAHLSILCWTLLMASQESHCENLLIRKRWWAQELGNWVSIHQSALVLVRQPAALSTEISLQNSCRPNRKQ